MTSHIMLFAVFPEDYVLLQRIRIRGSLERSVPRVLNSWSLLTKKVMTTLALQILATSILSWKPNLKPN